VFEFEITTEASFFLTSQTGAMLVMPPKDRVSSTAVQHSDGVSTTHIRRVNHHAEIPRESYVDFTTPEHTPTAPRRMKCYEGVMARQPEPVADRLFDIEFVDPGAEAFDFTFG
jgi:hypothetical protein